MEVSVGSVLALRITATSLRAPEREYPVSVEHSCGNTPNVCVFEFFVILGGVVCSVGPPGRACSRVRENLLNEMWTTTKTTKYGVGEFTFEHDRKGITKGYPSLITEIDRDR